MPPMKGRSTSKFGAPTGKGSLTNSPNGMGGKGWNGNGNGNNGNSLDNFFNSSSGNSNGNNMNGNNNNMNGNNNNNNNDLSWLQGLSAVAGNLQLPIADVRSGGIT